MNNFYFPSLSAESPLVELAGDEAKHIVGARRLKLLDKITLFNGNGLVSEGGITLISAKSVQITLFDTRQLSFPKPRIVLASAVPKGNRFNIMLDMATQLGMTDFIPLLYERSGVKTIESKLDRYTRICVSACKQSQRYFVPKIHKILTLSQLFEIQLWEKPEFYFADPDGSSINQLTYGDDNSSAMVLIIGPEGGFTAKEIELFNQKNAEKIQLSYAILRIETACISMLSKINYVSNK